MAWATPAREPRSRTTGAPTSPCSRVSAERSTRRLSGLRPTAGRPAAGRPPWRHDRHPRHRCRHQHRRRRAPGGRAAGAVAGQRDRRPRQPGAAQPLGAEGRRAPGVERVDHHDHDRALAGDAGPGGPGVGEAARLAGAARPGVPARPAARGQADHAARVRRAAVLPLAAQGPGARRLLDRLGRHRGDRADLGRDRPPVRQHPVRHRRRRPAVVPGRGRRARRGRGLGGRGRPDGRRARRGRLGRRPQPAVPGPGGADVRGDPAAGHVRRRRLAGAHRQVRRAAGGAVHPGRRSRAARPDRRDDQPGVPADAAPHGRRAARAPARGRRRGRRRGRADRRGGRRRPGGRRPQPRRARPGRAAHRVRADRRHPPDRGAGLHAQGLRPGHRGPPAEPLRAAHRGPAARAGRPGRGGPGRPVGPVRPVVGPGSAARRRRRTGCGGTEHEGATAPAVPTDLGRTPSGTATTQAALGRTLLDLNRAAPEAGARVVTVSPDVSSLDQPRRLGEQGRRLVGRGPATTGSPTTPRRSCTGGSGPAASTSSWASPRSTWSG